MYHLSLISLFEFLSVTCFLVLLVTFRDGKVAGSGIILVSSPKRPKIRLWSRFQARKRNNFNLRALLGKKLFKNRNLVLVSNKSVRAWETASCTSTTS